MFYKKGGGDIWSILTLNNVFFLGKMEKTRVTEGGFTYSHNIISIYHPKWWFFGEDQKCSWGPKMKNKPNFFFDNRGFPNWGGGGSAAWEFFPHNPVFFLRTSLIVLITITCNSNSWGNHNVQVRGMFAIHALMAIWCLAHQGWNLCFLDVCIINNSNITRIGIYVSCLWE